MDILYVLDIAGTLTFAVSGVLSAIRRKYDLFGFFVIAFMAAVGGGTIRDLVLNRHPVFWIKDSTYLLTIIAACIVTPFLFRRMDRLQGPFLFFDAVGLGVFTLIGIRAALDCGVNPMLSVLMGTVTAVMGGMLRDLFCHVKPVVLKREIYATACILGGILFFVLRELRIPETINSTSVIFIIILIRLISLKLHLSLPGVFER